MSGSSRCHASWKRCLRLHALLVHGEVTDPESNFRSRACSWRVLTPLARAFRSSDLVEHITTRSAVVSEARAHRCDDHRHPLLANATRCFPRIRPHHYGGPSKTRNAPRGIVEAHQWRPSFCSFGTARRTRDIRRRRRAARGSIRHRGIELYEERSTGCALSDRKFREPYGAFLWLAAIYAQHLEKSDLAFRALPSRQAVPSGRRGLAWRMCSRRRPGALDTACCAFDSIRGAKHPCCPDYKRDWAVSARLARGTQVSSFALSPRCCAGITGHLRHSP